MTAHLIVRADVPDADREAFDQWYEEKHLPEAVAGFEAIRGWRGWSEIEANLHYATYEFADVAAALAIADSAVIKTFIAEFDDRWQGRVTRTREVIDCKQQVDGAA